MMGGLDPDVYDVINEVIQETNPFAKDILSSLSLMNEDTQAYEHVIEPAQMWVKQFDFPDSEEKLGLNPNDSGYLM